MKVQKIFRKVLTLLKCSILLKGYLKCKLSKIKSKEIVNCMFIYFFQKNTD